MLVTKGGAWAELKLPKQISKRFSKINASPQNTSLAENAVLRIPASRVDVGPKNGSKLGPQDLPRGQLGARTPRPKTFLWLGRPDLLSGQVRTSEHPRVPRRQNLHRRATQTSHFLAIVFSQLFCRDFRGSFCRGVACGKITNSLKSTTWVL